MTAAKRPTIENKPSFLLSRDENDQLFKLIGPRCKSMASAVVQVFFADTAGRNQWNKRHCGVLCFIKDNTRRSYFLRVFCLDQNRALWEQELYSSFEYKSPRNYFHTFEGDDCRVGFNFADEAEADFYLAVVNENLRAKMEKRAERRRQSQQNMTAQPPKVMATNGSAALHQAPRPSVVSVTTNMSSTSISSKKNNKKDKNKKITKADIGLPSDFKHVSHVGWDPNQGFALENVDPHLLQFFAKAGVSESHLQDKATRDFIYDFIDKHGGTEAAIREISNQSSAFGGASAGGGYHAPPVPARNPPTPQTARQAPPAPPAAAPPPPPPSRIVASPQSTPPPAPPQRAPVPKMSAPAPISSNAPLPPPPPPMNAAPPPPPLPSSAGPTPPPPPPSASYQPAQPDPRNALMDAIKGGPKLKSVDPQEKPKVVNDTRSDLLSQIRGGKELKPVEVSKHPPLPVPADESLEGMAGALARALENRFNVIHSDSEESGNEVDEDDDWDE